MTKIIKITLCLILCIISVLLVVKSSDNTLNVSAATVSKKVWDGTSTVDVTNDDGSKVTYWKQTNNVVQRATSYSYPLQSLRATWVSQFISSIPNYSTEEKWKEDVKTLLDRCEEYGLNCIVFHLRTHNNACYKTDLAPVATFMEKADFDKFDPLTYLIEETHNRSIEFHAWLNPYRVNDSYCAEDYPACNPASNSANILSNGSGKILNPGIPEVQDFLVNVCREICENYDVDAIHFDDYFYISDVDDSATRAKYNTKNLSVDNFRRAQVDSFISKLSASIKEYNKLNNKTVQIGISPPGGYQNNSKTGTSYPSSPTYNADGSLKTPIGSNTSCFCSYGNYLYADTLKWINNEWIDYIMPQTYWALNHGGASYADLSLWWSWAVKNKKVNLYTGIGYYMAAGSGSSATYWQKNINQIRDILLVAQTREEIGGVCYYSYNYLNSSNNIIKTGMNLIKNDYYQTKIPADVKKYYAGVYPTPDASDVLYTSSKITWTKGNNLRGYLIFKVNKGETLNLNNDLQVAYYGNGNSYNVTDSTATYYISTVNLANEISTPKIISMFEKTPSKMIEYINQIPNKSDNNYRNYIEQIYSIYEKFTDSDKQKVTNKNVLLNLVEYLNTFDEYNNKLRSYCNMLEYSKERQDDITKYLNDAQNNISNSTTKEEIINIYNEYVSKVDKLPKASVELKEPKLSATNYIEDYYKNLNKEFYTSTNQNNLLNVFLNYRKQINNANSLTTIESLQKDCIKAYNSVPSLEAEYNNYYNVIVSGLNSVIDNVKEEEYYNFYQEKITNLYNEYVNKIKTEKVQDVIDNSKEIKQLLVDEFDNEVYNYYGLYKEYSSIINTMKLYDGNKQGLEDLKNQTIEKLNNANSLDEMKEIFSAFKTSYDALPLNKTVTPTSGCTSLNILYYLISITALIFVFKKKNRK